jgi:hypothetical protein
MTNQELLSELKTKFEGTKKELGLKYSFEDYNRIFFLKDMVLSARFVSEEFSRMLSRRVVDTYVSWNNYLNGLLVPPPGHVAMSTEAQLFNEQDHEKLFKLVAKIAKLINLNMLVGVTQDKKSEAEFLNEAVRFWDEEVKQQLTPVIRKCHDNWVEKSK